MKILSDLLSSAFIVLVGISNYLSIHAAPSSSEVVLRVNITSTRKLILSCVVPVTPIATTTHLYCPLTGGSPCYLDCVTSCILVGGFCKPLEDLKATLCSSRQEGSTRITTYILDATDRKNKGEWFCVHGGKRSSGFFLDIDKLLTTTKKPTTTRPTTTTRHTTSTTTTTTKAPAVIPKRTTPKMSLYEGNEENLLPIPKPETEDDLRRYQEYQDAEVKHLTRPDLVIAILSLLALSLIVNLAFCIRCILVRKFIEIQRAGEKESACLNSCLCIPRSQPSLQVPKVPRDCIYEEITTSPSSAPRRRPSNCSSTMRTFSTGIDGTTPTFDGRPFSRRGSMPRSRSFPVKAVPITAQTLQQHPSYIYVAATENGGMLLEPVLTPSSRVSSQQLYDDVASEGLHSLNASTNAIYARVQKASHQLQQRQAHHQLQQHLQDLHEQQQLQQDEIRGRKQTDTLPPTLDEQQEEETTPLTGSPVHSQAEPKAVSDAGTERSRASSSPANPDNNPKNNSRLELSKSLLQKADTLLREAGCLLD